MQIPIADAHCDFLYYAITRDYNLYNPIFGQIVTKERLEQGNVALQFFAVWTDKRLKITPLEQSLNMISEYHRILKTHHDDFVPFTRDFMPNTGSIATVLTVEDGMAMMGNIRNLDIFYNLGVRAMTLTWNNVNELGYPSTHKKNIGLTDLGRETVKRMNELGIAIDLAHLNDAGIDDILELLDQNALPAFSSHTNARQIYNTKRSLCDEHIREIAQRNGVIGVNFYHAQLCDRGEACISDIVRHIEHIAQVGGIDCICIGSDFDGMNKYPPDLRHSGDFPLLVDELLKLGYTNEQVYKIMYGNLRDYIAKFVN